MEYARGGCQPARIVPFFIGGASCKYDEIIKFERKVSRMITKIKNAHEKLEHIFKNLLPKHNMPERAEQMRLSHRILDAMFDKKIALCDAGTGIGKTYAYLAAGIVYHISGTESGQLFQPLIISTSSIALQNAIQNEYLPFLTKVLLDDGMIHSPIRAVVRKGKSHYVCDERLERHL